jgi:hypothetical protein
MLAEIRPRIHETELDARLNHNGEIRLGGNDLRNVSTLLLIPDTVPLTQRRKVSNVVSADATRVVSHGAEGNLVMRPSAPAGIGPPPILEFTGESIRANAAKKRQS